MRRSIPLARETLCVQGRACSVHGDFVSDRCSQYDCSYPSLDRLCAEGRACMQTLFLIGSFSTTVYTPRLKGETHWAVAAVGK